MDYRGVGVSPSIIRFAHLRLMPLYGARARRPRHESAPNRLRLHIQRRRRGIEILEQRRAQPTLHRRQRRGRAIPRAAGFTAIHLELRLIPRKWLRREEQAKSFARVREVANQQIDHLRHARDKRLARQSDCGVVEHPCAFIPVWFDDEDRIHSSNDMPRMPQLRRGDMLHAWANENFDKSMVANWPRRSTARS